MSSSVRITSAPIQPTRSSRRFKRSITLFTFILFALVLSRPAEAQKQRLRGPITDARRTVLAGHIHPEARIATDQGAVEPAFALPHMSIVFKRTPDQETDLEQLLARQQDPSSAEYHRWLTPQEFGDRFGLNQSDVTKVKSWLESNGFTVKEIAPSRTYISFSGTAQQVQKSLRTSIRRYRRDGQDFYANQDDPSVPEALGEVVLSIHGLSSFRLRHTRPSPQSILPGSSVNTLGPKDFSTIYNVAPLIQRGITGSGQTIAVLGESSLSAQIATDNNTFRQLVGLPASTIIYYDVDKVADRSSESRDEANLDVQWAGGVAPSATIAFYRAYDVFTAAQYVVANNLAPVMSMSFGACETTMGSSQLSSFRSLAQQGSAQGITWVSASGDDGAYPNFFGCGLSAEFPASIPEIVAVGGTQFNEQGGNYWSASTGALSYIPEIAWNDGNYGATGGGISRYYSQPTWQNGIVQADGFRHVPDVALSASPGRDPYFIVTGGNASRIGGTSAGAPAFAAIVALLNQQSGRQGNMNPGLYAISVTTPTAFHDITSGDNNYYFAGPGYDEVTGLGSVNASVLVTNWKAVAPPPPSPLAQLVITSVTGDTSAAPGGKINVSVTIMNNGSGAAGPFRVGEYLSKSSALPTAGAQGYFNYCDVPSLAAGAKTNCSAAATVPSNLTAGAYYLSALADVNSQVQQSSRTANARMADSGAVTLTAAASCSYVPSITQTSLTADGGLDSFFLTVTPGCSWTASTTANWITLSTAAGSTSGYVTFTAAPNPGAARSTTITVTGGVTFTVTQASYAAPASSGLRLVPVTPCRVVDTRNPNGAFGAPSMSAAQTRSFTITQGSCGIPAVAAAYSLNITVVPKAGLSYLTVWPTGQAQPFVSTLNAPNGGAVANAAIVPAGANGAISVYATEQTDVIIDINGYFAPPTYTPASGLSLVFHPITPCRLADTRTSQFAPAFGAPSLVGGSTRLLPALSGNCGLPATAQAYSVNVTAVPQGPLGYISIWPAGQSQPVVSTLNAYSGQVTANAAIVPAGANGGINLYASNTTDVVVDVNGYFSPPDATQGYEFYTLAPCRVMDTRAGQGTSGSFGPPSVAASTSRDVPVANGRCPGIPSNAAAYALNATVVPAGSLGYLTLWPSGQSRPGVSTLNSYNGSITANAAIVPAGTNGSVSAYASDLTDVLLDISGYFAP